jgi:hypothetical protein
VPAAVVREKCAAFPLPPKEPSTGVETDDVLLLMGITCSVGGPDDPPPDDPPGGNDPVTRPPV